MNYKKLKNFLLAKKKKLSLASAPSSVLNITARTLRDAIKKIKLEK